jgi:peptidoglycan/xylan/chitin deacetylase (PgdA/CDA1 family)
MKKKLLIVVMLSAFLVGGCGQNSENLSDTVTPTATADDADNTANDNSDNSSSDNSVNESTDSTDGTSEDTTENKDSEVTAEYDYDDSDFLASIERDENTKLIAITIDDGPDGDGTAAYLDVIEEAGIRATFFVMGKYLSSNGDQLVRMIEDGCEVGNHSYNHDYLTKMTTDEITDDIQSTNEEIEEILPGYTVKYVRAPYFSYNEDVYNTVNAPLIDAALQESGTDYDATSSVLMGASDGDIVLLHSWNTASMEALRDAIPTLQEQGFIFVTVSELFELQNITPVEGVVYRNVSYNRGSEYVETEVLSDEEGYSDGVWDTWSPAVTLDNTKIQNMTEDMAVKVEYTSASAPCMVLQSFTTGSSWCQIECSFDDGQNAYFTYEDLMSNFEDLTLCDTAFIYPWGSEITVSKVSLVSMCN